MTAGTVSPDEMLPKRMPLPGGSGWRMSPVRTPVWSPCPFTTTPRAMVRCGSTRAGATAAGAVVPSRSTETLPSSARPTTWSRASSWKGFSRKSNAPRRITRTAVSIVPWPEMTMIGNRGARDRRRPHGELHDEPAAARQVVARPDEAVVVGDDRRHDGEPEACAVGLGGEVGLEEPGLHLGRHALAVVGDFEPHDAEPRHVD